MENSTKERLTGALILVAALVILVPEMLSGPRGDDRGAAPAADPQAGPPLRTYDMALDPAAAGRQQQAPAPTPVDEVAAVPPPVIETVPPAAEAAAAPPQAGQADAAADTAAPDSTPAPASPAPSPPVAKAAESKPSPAAAAKPATEEARPAASSGKWWVQAGVFSSRDNAQRLARELTAAGIPTVVSQITVQGKAMHRVRAGPVADRPAALALQARLAAKGHKSTLVAP